MKEFYKKKIILFLQKNGKKSMLYKELAAKCKVKKNEVGDFNQAVIELKSEGIVFEKRSGFVLVSRMGAFPATVSRVNKTFGFIKRADDDSEVFIPGKFLIGSMPGDFVIARLIESRSGSPEGEVLKVLKENDAQFTGVIVEIDGTKFIQPDSLTKTPLAIKKGKACDFAAGEKVIAEVTSRGERHSEHRASIIAGFGSSDKASACANSVLMLNGITPDFSIEVSDEAKFISGRRISEKEIESRTDLRNEVIFTIDGADTKDIDDAVSIKRFDDFYELGVHIADVSHYVKPGSALDKEAFSRGTSVYYANRVVPMLPKELSNGICSLNPQVDRLAFSCIMVIGLDGKLQDFDFKKTVIRSRVQGVYSEINQILDGTESSAVRKKYAECRDTIMLMEELAAILTANKIKRGAPQIETSESKLIINEDDFCVDIKARERGKSELIIEEFMLMANQSAATLGRLQQAPFVYRIHEDPTLEKISDLRATMQKMGVEVPNFTTVKPAHLAEILKKAKGTAIFPIVNKLVLRSMAKAKYSTDPIGHFGLVLSDYAHFTSPIRRYPDLSIHRIMSDIINGVPAAAIKKKYSGFAAESANHSSETELTAMRVERDCEDCYKAEYMNSHLGEEFEGVISSVVEYGFYVELPNTVEGLVRVETLTDGSYDFDGMICFTNMLTGRKYTIGDPVKVVCSKAEVSSGRIDFDLAE